MAALSMTFRHILHRAIMTGVVGGFSLVLLLNIVLDGPKACSDAAAGAVAALLSVLLLWEILVVCKKLRRPSRETWNGYLERVALKNKYADAVANFAVISSLAISAVQIGSGVGVTPGQLSELAPPWFLNIAAWLFWCYYIAATAGIFRRGAQHPPWDILSVAVPWGRSCDQTAK